MPTRALRFAGAMAAVALSLCFSPGWAIEKIELKRAGALNCLTERAGPDAPRGIDTILNCELDLFASDVPTRFYGHMSGEGLYLVDPEGIAVRWSVLSPTRQLDPKALIGNYDRTSRWAFEMDDRPDLLIGGDADSIGLELVTPPLGPLDPQTRLTLMLQDPKRSNAFAALCALYSAA